MSNFVRLIPATLKRFHHDIDLRSRKIGNGIAGLSMLSTQLSVHEHVLKDVANSTKDMIIAKQKDINREFVPVVERAMQSAYDWCTEEHGKEFLKLSSRHQVKG